MQEPPQKARRTEEPDRFEGRGDAEASAQQTDRDARSLRETIETAASAYFSACRKLARAINRFKQS